MKIIIEASPNEIAALVVAIQERPSIITNNFDAVFKVIRLGQKSQGTKSNQSDPITPPTVP